MSRGALYIVWEGKENRTEQMLARSIDSLGIFHPELPHHVQRLPAGSTLLDKAAMLDLTPFDETLFLDADTIVMGRLDYAFEKAVKHGLAACICENPWARRYPSCKGDLVEYNAGILWFTKAAKPVFDRWQALNRTIDSSIIFKGAAGMMRMSLNDQAGFALAIDELGFNPYVLPLNWNFRPRWHKTWFGPVKIWHDYDNPPLALVKFTAEQNRAGAVVLYAEMGRSA